MDIKEKVKTLPSSPGVYLMKDSDGSVIYVGKSKNLKSRVGSYFIKSKSHSPKTLKLVNNLKDFEYILTDTEFEAFILECKLIKKIKPMYNRLMKNPNSYSYIKIAMNEDYPRIEISNKALMNDGNLYFGPFNGSNIVERGIQGIKEFYKIPCTYKFKRPSSCLNYSLGLCIGVCLNDNVLSEYVSIIKKVIDLLKGINRIILEDLEHHMQVSAQMLNFEEAAKYRDYINAVNYIINKSKVVKYASLAKNIVMLERLDDSISKIFLIKGNKILFSEKYPHIDIDNLKSILINKILSLFDNKSKKNAVQIGVEEIDEAQIIYSYLKSKSTNCSYAVIPQKWIYNLEETKILNALNKIFSKNLIK